MSDMTAEVERFMLAHDLDMQVRDPDALKAALAEFTQAAAAQAQAGVDALAEEIVALREDLEKADAQARAEEREAWHEFPGEAPPPHQGVWHVYRQGVGFFYATVCYGMHAPWWVPQYAERGKPGMSSAQGDPMGMHEGDLWQASPDPAAIRALSTD